MRILALDSSTDWLSVALSNSDGWQERGERAATAASERALPLVRALLGAAGLRVGDLDGIAFGAGPGSFTGVRIACGIAQGLALGADLPVVAIPTLLALAQHAWRTGGTEAVFACLDARMREVYVAAYEYDGLRWRVVLDPAVAIPGEAPLPPGDDWTGVGNGFAAYPALRERFGGALAGCEEGMLPTAVAIGSLALPRFAAGEGVPAREAAPLYVRHRVALTTAERAAGMRL